MIGVMQGRLLPKYQGRYQAFPIGTWKQEFDVAQKIGLDCIEFILDFNDADANPLLCERGIEKIQAMIEVTSVSVRTVCADYFMEVPLHSVNDNLSEQSRKIMVRLLNNAADLGVTDLVIPCVDQSSINGKEDTDRFIKKLLPLIEIAEKKEINFSLETDLAPGPFIDLLDSFDSTRVTVNYDIGNSAALGYNSIEELDAYGDKITDIHIKDRELGGGPVVLGQGNADFSSFFKKLSEFDYQGPFIMQAYRDEDGVEIFRQQLEWVKPYLR